MKKQIFYFAALGAFLLTSCAQDELIESLEPAVNTQISYSVIAGNGTRAASAYGNGTDIDEIHVAAWAVTPKIDEDGNATFALPGYGSPNGGNASIIDHDAVPRSGTGKSGTSGTFNYDDNARFWPTDGQKVDFWALVDAPDEDNCFSWTGCDGHPGLPNKVEQLGKSDMKDMLYGYAPNQTLNKEGHQAQQNVSFSMNHAFAKVIITAQVKNSNLHVVIKDAEIHGIVDGGNFSLPYKSGSGPDVIDNPASWTPSSTYTDLAGLIDKEDIVVDKNYATGGDNPGKVTVAGVSTYDDNNKIVKNNDILVIPENYNGRDGSNKIQTYIQLTAYAYNIAGTTFDEDTDALVCGTTNADGEVVPAVINIPVEFDWKMGTINTYNIIFDCGVGGSTTEDPKDPALVRIGYEVEVKPWVTLGPVDKEYDFATGKTK